MSYAGRVTSFQAERGYGWITPDPECGLTGRVFVHIKDVLPDHYTGRYTGAELERAVVLFDLEATPEGLRAVGVRCL
jgi:cold shock CspA family protein